MVFKRRDKPPFLSRLREMMLPQKGWHRGIEYLSHRVKRLPDTPHRIALGVACGVYVSFTPFFGLHFVLAAAVAKLVRGNILASLIGTAFGNPVTFPFIASAALSVGRRILGYGVTGRDFGRVYDAFNQFFAGLWQSVLSYFGDGEPQWDRLTIFLRDVFWPYCVGGILPGLASAAACYFLCRPVIAAYQIRRRAKLLARIKAQRAEATPKGEDAGEGEGSDGTDGSPYIGPRNKKSATN